MKPLAHLTHTLLVSAAMGLGMAVLVGIMLMSAFFPMNTDSAESVRQQAERTMAASERVQDIIDLMDAEPDNASAPKWERDYIYPSVDEKLMPFVIYARDVERTGMKVYDVTITMLAPVTGREIEIQVLASGMYVTLRGRHCQSLAETSLTQCDDLPKETWYKLYQSILLFHQGGYEELKQLRKEKESLLDQILKK